MKVTINDEWTFAEWRISDVPLTKDILDFLASAIYVTNLPLQLSPVLYNNRRLADLREPLSEYNFKNNDQLVVPCYFRDSLLPNYQVLQPKSVFESEKQTADLTNEKSRNVDKNVIVDDQQAKPEDNVTGANDEAEESSVNNNTTEQNVVDNSATESDESVNVQRNKEPNYTNLIPERQADA